MSSAKSWFVQTGFGATLGPMPRDALLEMVRTGSLLRTDQVRAGDDDEWRLASEIPGLFDAVSATPTSTKQSAPHKVVEPAPTVQPSPTPISPKINLIPPQRPASREPSSVPVTAPVTVATAHPETVTASRDVAPVVVPWVEDVAVSATAPPEDHLIAAWKSQRMQSKEELGMVSLAAEMNQAENEFAPELPADLLDEQVESASIAATNTKPASRPAVHRPSFLDQIAGLEDGPRRRVETSQQKWDRWRRSLPAWPIAVAVALVLFTTWSYWPRSQRGFYDRYVAIWAEWKTRRTDFKDKEGWDRFLKHTAAELDDMLPWLEKHAQASDRESLLLLWIGRDCFRKMLKSPRQSGMTEEKQLQKLLADIRALHESPGEGLGASQDADPEQPAGAGAFDPNTGRPETKNEVPAVPAAPTKSNVSP